uniref:Alpha-1,3/1,6-mannosyltransferase ALG2 n=1 Tax=Aegilops tauschii subsp. strangulata TaxID=200361 RepID=A0A453CX72_AEGTS
AENNARTPSLFPWPAGLLLRRQSSALPSADRPQHPTGPPQLDPSLPTISSARPRPALPSPAGPPSLEAMAAAAGVAGESSGTKTRKLKVAVIHPDLGIGGAERLIVDAACQLAAHGHDVHVFTSHHDRNRCFEETVSGPFPVTVYGDFLPRHVFYRFHAVCAYLRCIFVALCVLLWWPSFDVILVDQVSVVIPLLKLKASSKTIFYCHFPDMLLAQHTTLLRRLYRKPIDMIEEATTGMADLILVNSKFTEATFARTFCGLHARGIEPGVLYPAVSVEQFHEPHDYKLNFLSINRFERKKNLGLAISAFALLRSVVSKQPGDALREASLTVAGNVCLCVISPLYSQV